MEVKVPRDILQYEESLFFGLTLRQFLFSVIAIAVAVGSFLLCKPMLGTETASWVCMVSALPFALLGFVRYNGMTADQFVKVWVRSEILFPKVLVYRGTNLYADLIEFDREEEANAKNKKPGKTEEKQKAKKQKEKHRREKDFERRGRNIFKFRKRGRIVR